MILAEILNAVMSQKIEQRNLVSKIEQLGENIIKIDERITKIEEKITKVIKQINDVEENLTAQITDVQEHLSSVEKLIDELRETTEKLSVKITNLEITIEGDVTPSIMRVVEGYIDFNRKFDETKNVESKLSANMEMYDLYTKHHNTEIKKIKNTLNIA